MHYGTTLVEVLLMLLLSSRIEIFWNFCPQQVQYTLNKFSVPIHHLYPFTVTPHILFFSCILSSWYIFMFVLFLPLKIVKVQTENAFRQFDIFESIDKYWLQIVYWNICLRGRQRTENLFGVASASVNQICHCLKHIFYVIEIRKTLLVNMSTLWSYMVLEFLLFLLTGLLLRPIPKNALQFRGDFQYCPDSYYCTNPQCKFAHSELELYEWNQEKQAMLYRKLLLLTTIIV